MNFIKIRFKFYQIIAIALSHYSANAISKCFI